MKFEKYNEFIDAASRGDSKKLQDLGKNAAEKLTDEQKQTIEKALSNPDLLNKMLSTPEAQDIIQKISRRGK